MFDSAGVTIVEHTDLRGDDVPRWELASEPVLRIGVVEGEEPYMLRSASRVRLLADGSLVVSEPREGELRTFAPDGHFVGSVGGTGDGPGEFRGLEWFGVLPGDSLVAWDSQLLRLTVFAPEGDVVRVVRPEFEPLGPGTPRAIGKGTDGSFVAAFRPREWPDPGGVQEIVNTIVRWNAERPSALDTLEVTRSAGAYIDDEMIIRIIPYQPAPFRVVHGTELYLGHGERFSLDVYDLEQGSLSRIVRVREPPAPIEASRVDAYWDGRLERASDDRARALVRRLRGELPIPDAFPAIDQVTLSREGELWVRRYRLPGDAGPRVWHVFDPGGTHLARVDVPDDLVVLHIAGDQLIARHRDELDVPRVKVFEVRREM